MGSFFVNSIGEFGIFLAFEASSVIESKEAFLSLKFVPTIDPLKDYVPAVVYWVVAVIGWSYNP